MIDEMLGGLFGELVLNRLPWPRRAQLLFRLFFGLVGALLGGAGAWHFAARAGEITNGALRASLVATFVFLAAFCLFNVALGRTWRWPGLGFVVSFVAIFATRILLGT